MGSSRSARSDACVAPIAPSTYHDHIARRADPEKLSARAKRDLMLKPEIECIFTENFEVYGARKSGGS
jgi:putative transposase